MVYDMSNMEGAEPMFDAEPLSDDSDGSDDSDDEDQGYGYYGSDDSDDESDDSDDSDDCEMRCRKSPCDHAHQQLLYCMAEQCYNPCTLEDTCDVSMKTEELGVR